MRSRLLVMPCAYHHRTPSGQIHSVRHIGEKLDPCAWVNGPIAWVNGSMRMGQRLQLDVQSTPFVSTRPWKRAIGSE